MASFVGVVPFVLVFVVIGISKAVVLTAFALTAIVIIGFFGFVGFQRLMVSPLVSKSFIATAIVSVVSMKSLEVL
jgi:hypothetical protein